jgi:NTE family protein
MVLSGGGIRGVAHIGFLRALEEEGIAPTIISGSSSGAVIGALYAAGYGWQGILRFFQDNTFFSFSKYAFGKPGMMDTSKYRPLLEDYFPHDDFQSLQRRLYVTTSDLINGETRIYSEGPLIDTLLASCAVPGVFSPVTMNGIVHIDGGVTNNFPVEPLIGKCDYLIGVFVNPLRKIKASELTSAFAVLERAFTMDRSGTSTRKFRHCDLLIAPQKLADYGMFSMSQINEIFEIGYEEAKQVLINDRLKKQATDGRDKHVGAET